MEKRKPSFDLEAFKAAAGDPERLEITVSAANSAKSLGLNRAGICGVVRTMKRNQFQKSMTSYADHRRWQDVYHVPWDNTVLYVKFTDDAIMEFAVLSFKER